MMATGTTGAAPAGPDHPAGVPVSGAGPLRLVRSELLKIRTTNTWWIFLIGVFFATALAATLWIAVGNERINDAADAGSEAFEPSDPGNEAITEMELQQFELSQDLTRTLHDTSAEIYTSGQFLGLMFAMLLGILLITNEFHHQTATTTFLATPRRTRVILGKLATVMLGAAFFWAFALVLSVVAGATFLALKGYGSQLGEWPVLRAILLNGLAYGLWGILGIGVGVLIRSQIAAVIVGAIAYLIGSLLIQQVLLPILYILLGWEWVVDVSWVWPGIASQIMVSPEPIYPGAPDWWVGALGLIGYGVAFSVVGTLITRRRDIS